MYYTGKTVNGEEIFVERKVSGKQEQKDAVIKRDRNER
jgi:hypothetical protein